LVSAGFDAHKLDPLAPLQLSTEVFGWMTDQMIDVAKRHCGGKLVSLLEGGYHLKALAECVRLHVERLSDSERGTSGFLAQKNSPSEQR
jgi:acetoin utilization deacetylase AcuC-like enzyme